MNEEQFQATRNSYSILGFLIRDLFSSMVEVTMRHNNDGQIETLSNLQREVNQLLIQYALMKPERDQSFIYTATRILTLSNQAKIFYRATRSIWYEKDGRMHHIVIPRRTTLVPERSD